MKYEEGMFPNGKLNLFYRCSIPEKPEGLFVILHGHGEHSGRYQKFFRILEDSNLLMAALDFRGQGRSEGAEVYVDSYDDFVDDISAFVSFLQSRYGFREKIYLFGHSNGGLAAIHWALRNPDKIHALFLSSPCLGLKLPPVLVGLNNILNCFAPHFLYQNPVYPPHLSHNPEEIQNYKNDTLIKRKISVRLIAEMLKAMDEIAKTPLFKFPFPVYVLAAGMEKVVDGEKTKLFFEKLNVPVKKIQIFDGFYHEIFNELHQERAFEALKSNLSEARRRT